MNVSMADIQKGETAAAPSTLSYELGLFALFLTVFVLRHRVVCKPGGVAEFAKLRLHAAAAILGELVDDHVMKHRCNV